MYVRTLLASLAFVFSTVILSSHAGWPSGGWNSGGTLLIYSGTNLVGTANLDPGDFSWDADAETLGVNASGVADNMGDANARGDEVSNVGAMTDANGCAVLVTNTFELISKNGAFYILEAGDCNTNENGAVRFRNEYELDTNGVPVGRFYIEQLLGGNWTQLFKNTTQPGTNVLTAPLIVDDGLGNRTTLDGDEIRFVVNGVTNRVYNDSGDLTLTIPSGKKMLVGGDTEVNGGVTADSFTGYHSGDGGGQTNIHLDANYIDLVGDGTLVIAAGVTGCWLRGTNDGAIVVNSDMFTFQGLVASNSTIHIDETSPNVMIRALIGWNNDGYSMDAFHVGITNSAGLTIVGASADGTLEANGAIASVGAINPDANTYSWTTPVYLYGFGFTTAGDIAFTGSGSARFPDGTVLTSGGIDVGLPQGNKVGGTNVFDGQISLSGKTGLTVRAGMIFEAQ